MKVKALRMMVLASSFLLTSFPGWAQTPYDKVVEALNERVAAYPQLVKPYVLGVNDQGIKILGVKIAPSLKHEYVRKHFVVGTHHGNEIDSVDVAMGVIDQLIERLTDADGDTLDDDVFYIVPVLNISGYNQRRREEWTSQNISVDPNRDYPDPCGNPNPYRLKSTRALADAISDLEITSAVTIHGYVGTLTYPWGTYTNQTHTLDHVTFDGLAKSAVAFNGYRTGTHADVIYPTVGAFEDWAYYQHGVWVMLLEMRRYVDVQKDARAIIDFLEKSPWQRSDQHIHTGSCRNIRWHDVLARP